MASARSRRKVYKVQDVLALLDGNSSYFGNDNERDEDDDFIASPAKDQDNNDDSGDSDSGEDNIPLAVKANSAKNDGRKKAVPLATKSL